MNEITKERFAMKVMSKKRLGRIFTHDGKSALANVQAEMAILKKLVFFLY